MPAAMLEEPQITWKPNRGGQMMFLSCPFWEALASGDRGGGKTTSLLMAFLAHVDRGYGPDWRGIIFRLSYPQLKDIIDASKVLISKSFPDARYRAGEEKSWEFPDGEVLMFRHLENLKSYDNYHGWQIPFLGFEELCNWPNSEAYEAMLSCSRRRSDREDVPLIVRATTNPFGVGHQWVKSRFITAKLPFTPYGEKGEERVHIPMLWRENTSYMESDPGYHRRLTATLSNESQKKAWTENDWNIIGGGRFSDVWRESIHVMEPFNIPMGWRIDRSHDWGSSAPFATYWFAESNGEKIEDGRSWPRGTLFAIHEDYGCEGNMHDVNWKPNVGLRLTPLEIAERTKQHETYMREWGLIKRQPQPGPADDNLFDVSHGRSMASIMAAPPYQIVWNRASKGPGSRVTGWQLLEDRLKASLQYPMEHPGIFVFNTCQHLIRTLPLAPRDPKKQEDIEMDEDHCLDSIRYRLLAYGGGNVVRGVSL